MFQFLLLMIGLLTRLRQGSTLASQNAWQERCTAGLLECIAIGGESGAARWDLLRARLTAEAERLRHPYPRVVIADCNLRDAVLRSWRFDHCYLARVDFTNADLRNASFDRAILRSCRLVRANLRGTQFLLTAIDGASLGWFVTIDKKTTLSFTGTGESLSGFDPHFRRRAEEDQRIYDIKSNGYNLIRLWYEFIDYGRSVRRILLILSGIIFVFGFMYALIYSLNPTTFLPGKWNIQDFIMMSAEKISNSPSLIDSHNIFVRFLFFSEGVAGLGALALLVAVLLRKLTILE